MFSSEIVSKDMNRSTTNFHQSNNSSSSSNHQNTNFKHLLTSTEGYMNQNTQSSGGLARYRSAPSSFFASLLNSDTENSSSGDESEAMFSAFINGAVDLNQKGSDQMQMQMQYVMKQEVGPMGYEGGGGGGGGGGVVGSYSMGIESQVNNVRGGNGNCSNLARQSSSPAGFFHGFSAMGEVGNYRNQNHSESSPASGLSNHMNFSSGPSSCLTFLPSIPEAGNETMGARYENGLLRNGHSSNGRESPNILKRSRDDDMKMFSNYSGLENTNDETRKRSSGLVHHLSLPKTPSEMANVEKFLQFQEDNVPCQIRAKRGFATHPRSIAERVRRTKISEKMKKLQDLFPDIDKQTNTAEMLDSAVQYIKDLQKKVQVLEDTRSKCVCSSKPPQSSLTT